MKKIFLAILLISQHLIIKAQDYDKIVANPIQVYDTFFTNYIVEDNYRWLENTTSKETQDWISKEVDLSKKYLAKTRSKTNSLRLIEKYNYVSFDYPNKAGKFYFTMLWNNSLGLPSLYYQTSLNSRMNLLVDPNYISKTDLIRIKSYSVSKDSEYLVYQFNRNGSDWAEAKVVTLNGVVHKKDHLTGLKFSNICWKDDGFFYSTFKQDGKFGKTLGQQVFFHVLGTQQADDKLIFARKNNPTASFSYFTTSGERFFVLKEIDEQKGIFNFFFIDYQSDNPMLKPLLMNLETNISIIDSHDGKFTARTSYESNNGTIVEIDPAKPLEWQTIAPEFSESVLLDVVPLSDCIIATYHSNQRPIFTVIDYSGKMLYSLEFPVATSVSILNSNYTDDEILFNFESFTVPPVVYKFNVKNLKKELLKETETTFDVSNFEYKEVECPINDSIRIPIILAYEKGIQLNGKNPAILEAYGGFGSIIKPSFDPGIVHFLKNGGIYAFANIRGGGDKGKEWAIDGRGINKQNSFDDFIAAAEYLIENNYTNSNKLAITGSSNGGLVVAVAATQRPDLFRVAVPVVAPLDMIRFDKFTVGQWHIDEYGSINDSLEFTKILNYSPYHNIKNEINYPSMLVVTSENDDRVPPFHSYKFVAELQNRTCQTNPVILRVEEKSGHNGASTLSTTIKEKAEIYGFIMSELSNKKD